jgi:uncharacterized coiled-coil protein SlyX
MDLGMARGMGQIEGRLKALEERVAHNEVSTAAQIAKLETSTSEALQRLENKIDTLFEKLTRGDERQAFRDGSTRGAKAMALLLLTVAGTLGGLLLEMGKLLWEAVHG